MTRKALFALALGASVLGPLTFARAQEGVPELLRHYQFLPRQSVVVETGGFAGRRTEYRVLGKYDFITGGEPWSADARFAQAEVWGSIISPDPAPAIVLDVDQTFNLEGLKGKQLPVAAPFDVFSFTGTTENGSSVRLLTALIGRWMYLRGETDAPPGSADFFEYQLRGLARQRPSADFNVDGLVDRVDFQRWHARMSSDALDAVDWADATDDALVDGADFLVWQRQFGDAPPDVTAVDGMMTALLASAASVEGVPEPTGGALGGAALAALAGARRAARRDYPDGNS